MKKTIFALSLVALLAAAPTMAQVDLSMYVALGDSMTAGLASGSLMDWYQDRSYPAVLANLATDRDFEQPLVSEPGFGPILELVSLAPTPVIAPVGLMPGQPVNAALQRPYNNLAVPASTVFDMIFTTGDINNLLQGNTDNAMHDLILRDGTTTALEQAIGLQPTFMTIWIGNADVLTAVLAATPADGITMTPVPFFAELYTNAIGVLATTTTADIVLINLPYSTLTPFATSVPPYVDHPQLGRVFLMADTGPLTENDRLTFLAAALIAQGYGLPGGPPLPDNLDLLTGEPGVVLREAEIDIINDRIDAYNAIIADAANTFGYEVFDANALFNDLVSGAWVPIFGGTTLSASFLQGGIFSYDAIHLQNIGSALFADELVQFINSEFGSEIPRVDMATALFEGDWQDPGVVPAKAQDVVMSKEAFQQLYELYPPNLDRKPEIRLPAARQPGESPRNIERGRPIHDR